MPETMSSLQVVGLDTVRFLLLLLQLCQADCEAVKKRRVGPNSPTDVTAFHWGYRYIVIFVLAMISNSPCRQRTWCKRDMPEVSPLLPHLGQVLTCLIDLVPTQTYPRVGGLQESGSSS